MRWANYGTVVCFGKPGEDQQNSTINAEEPSQQHEKWATVLAQLSRCTLPVARNVYVITLVLCEIDQYHKALLCAGPHQTRGKTPVNVQKTKSDISDLAFSLPSLHQRRSDEWSEREMTRRQKLSSILFSFWTYGKQAYICWKILQQRFFLSWSSTPKGSRPICASATCCWLGVSGCGGGRFLLRCSCKWKVPSDHDEPCCCSKKIGHIFYKYLPKLTNYSKSKTP